MSMTFGEFEVSPASLKKLLAAPQIGRRYVLLDSVRDAAFLTPSSPIPDGQGGTISDMGLGVVDNGLFVYTSKFKPGSPTTPRPYPLKFFWIGSPAGTNDKNDVFAIFVADVNSDAFYPGAPAAVWLLNPRLVLSVPQAKHDIINWFDANYPYTVTPASGGVGQETPNRQSNTTYGTLSLGGSPGNISAMDSLDGQFWPVYDYVDNSILLYFSIKTPNCNTLSVYCYKISDSEIGSALSSTQFLGGVYNSTLGNDYSALISSHRFSIISPDSLVTTPRIAGTQSAVIAYAFGTFDTVSADHARWLKFSILQDIHGSPLNWNTQTLTSNRIGVDVSGAYNPDKLGSLFSIPQGNQVSSTYALLYNATSDRDARRGSNGVVINAMQIRIAFFHTGTGTCGFGDDIAFSQDTGIIGYCRPQFSTFPDGLPKIIYNNFAFDQSLQTAYQYVDPLIMKPSSQRKLCISFDPFPRLISICTFGKKKMSVKLILGDEGWNSNQVSQTDPAKCVLLQISPLHGGFSYSTPYYFLNNWDEGTLIQGTQETPYSIFGNAQLNYSQIVCSFEIRDPPPYLGLNVATTLSTQLPNIFGVINLED
jgi:hypothetical protein